MPSRDTLEGRGDSSSFFKNSAPSTMPQVGVEWVRTELLSASRGLAPTALRLGLENDVISLGRSIERCFIYLREKQLFVHVLEMMGVGPRTDHPPQGRDIIKSRNSSCLVGFFSESKE